MFEEFQQTFSEEIVSTISDIAKEIHENLQALIMSTMQNAEKLEHSLNYHIRNMNKSLLDYLNLDAIRSSDNDFSMNSRFKNSRYEDAVRDFENDTEKYIDEAFARKSIKSEPKEHMKPNDNTFQDEYFQERAEEILRRGEPIKNELPMRIKKDKADYLLVSSLADEQEDRKTMIEKVKKPKREPRNGTFPCEQCTFVTNRKDSLEKHVKAIHEGLKDYPCDFCEFITAHRRNLKRHKFRAHKEAFERELKMNLSAAQNQLLDLQKEQNGM